MQQRQMIIIKRLQDVTNEIKADLRAACLKSSSPVSDNSARVRSISVNPSEQYRVTMRDSGKFDEFKTPAALRKVDVADKPERETYPWKKNRNNNQSKIQRDRG